MTNIRFVGGLTERQIETQVRYLVERADRQYEQQLLTNAEYASMMRAIAAWEDTEYRFRQRAACNDNGRRG